MEDIKKYVKENKLTWPVGFDEGDKIAKIYGIIFGAGVILIDAEGIVQGRFGREDLEKEIKKIL